jgi:hypothetical protein
MHMAFGSPSGPEDAWWTVPYDGEPAVKLFMPPDAEPDQPVVLIWQGFTSPDPVFRFVEQIHRDLRIERVESLVDDPPRPVAERQFGAFMHEASAPDRHFFVAFHCEHDHETVRLWGDGPRSKAGGLTPEVGIAIRSPVLWKSPVRLAVAGLLQASLRWRGVPLDEIHPVLEDLAERTLPLAR